MREAAQEEQKPLIFTSNCVSVAMFANTRHPHAHSNHLKTHFRWQARTAIIAYTPENVKNSEKTVAN